MAGDDRRVGGLRRALPRVITISRSTGSEGAGRRSSSARRCRRAPAPPAIGHHAPVRVSERLAGRARLRRRPAISTCRPPRLCAGSHPRCARSGERAPRTRGVLEVMDGASTLHLHHGGILMRGAIDDGLGRQGGVDENIDIGRRRRVAALVDRHDRGHRQATARRPPRLTKSSLPEDGRDAGAPGPAFTDAAYCRCYGEPAPSPARHAARPQGRRPCRKLGGRQREPGLNNLVDVDAALEAGWPPARGVATVSLQRSARCAVSAFGGIVARRNGDEPRRSSRAEGCPRLAGHRLTSSAAVIVQTPARSVKRRHRIRRRETAPAARRDRLQVLGRTAGRAPTSTAQADCHRRMSGMVCSPRDPRAREFSWPTACSFTYAPRTALPVRRGYDLHHSRVHHERGISLLSGGSGARR